jgi:cytochrome c biogenesis protein CcmG/thiol:disulfide interchange protein DsbE
LMRGIARTLCFLLVLMALLVTGCESKSGGKKGEATGTAFALKDLKGNTVRLSDLKGKVVMVEFWATWCPPCRMAVPELEDIYARYKDRGFALVAISMDTSEERVAEFVKEEGINYTVVMDDGDVSSRYGVISIPVAFILDKEGNIVSKHMGFVPGLGEEFAKDIEELL